MIIWFCSMLHGMHISLTSPSSLPFLIHFMLCSSIDLGDKSIFTIMTRATRGWLGASAHCACLSWRCYCGTVVYTTCATCTKLLVLGYLSVPLLPGTGVGVNCLCHLCCVCFCECSVLSSAMLAHTVSNVNVIAVHNLLWFVWSYAGMNKSISNWWLCYYCWWVR